MLSWIWSLKVNCESKSTPCSLWSCISYTVTVNTKTEAMQFLVSFNMHYHELLNGTSAQEGYLVPSVSGLIT